MGWKEPNRCEELLPLLGIQAEEKHITFGALCRLQYRPPPATSTTRAAPSSATEGSSDTCGRSLLVPRVEEGTGGGDLRMAPNNPL